MWFVFVCQSVVMWDLLTSATCNWVGYTNVTSNCSNGKAPFRNVWVYTASVAPCVLPRFNGCYKLWWNITGLFISGCHTWVKSCASEELSLLKRGWFFDVFIGILDICQIWKQQIRVDAKWRHLCVFTLWLYFLSMLLPFICLYIMFTLFSGGLLSACSHN